MDLASDTDALSEGKNFATPQSKTKSAKRNADKFLKVGRKKYFQTKSVLRGRIFHPDILSMDLVKQVCELLKFQGWEELFLEPSLIYEKEVVDFYTNLVILEGDVMSSGVKGVDIVFDATKLGEILHIPSVGINEIIGVLMSIQVCQLDSRKVESIPGLKLFKGNNVIFA